MQQKQQDQKQQDQKQKDQKQKDQKQKYQKQQDQKQQVQKQKDQKQQDQKQQDQKQEDQKQQDQKQQQSNPSKYLVMKRVDKFTFNVMDPIGKGSFGVVYLATLEDNTKFQAAIKMISKDSFHTDPDLIQNFKREIEILRKISGEHILKLLDVKTTEKNIYIITEYCDGGDLEKLIKSKREFTLIQCLKILKQIVKAFIELSLNDICDDEGHRVVILHRDIKPANIFIHNRKIKIGDFGFARMIDVIDKEVRMRHTALGTPNYMAPQIFSGEPYSSKCDVWSVGIVFYQLLYGKLPWTGNSQEELFQNIRTQPLTFPESKKNPPQVENLVKAMLQLDERRRVSFEDIICNPLLKQNEI